MTPYTTQRALVGSRRMGENLREDWTKVLDMRQSVHHVNMAGSLFGLNSEIPVISFYEFLMERNNSLVGMSTVSFASLYR